MAVSNAKFRELEGQIKQAMVDFGQMTEEQLIAVFREFRTLAQDTAHPPIAEALSAMFVRGIKHVDSPRQAQDLADLMVLYTQAVTIAAKKWTPK